MTPDKDGTLWPYERSHVVLDALREKPDTVRGLFVRGVAQGMSRSELSTELLSLEGRHFVEPSYHGGATLWTAVRCTTEHPRSDANWAVHDELHEVNGSQQPGWPGGDIVIMACRSCGREWESELPQ